MDNYTVYKHTTPSGKVYIGITCRAPQRRWKNGSGYRENEHFYRAIQKYGWENITHEILFEGLTKEDASEKEVELIAKYQSNNSKYGYNKSFGGDAGFTGLHHTEEVKRKISETKKGKKAWNKGVPMSEETRRKMSKAKRGKDEKILCIETGIIYFTQIEAARKTHIKQSRISMVCNGKAKTAGGYHWQYVTS